jgi:hypothetical protein
MDVPSEGEQRPPPEVEPEPEPMVEPEGLPEGIPPLVFDVKCQFGNARFGAPAWVPVHAQLNGAQLKLTAPRAKKDKAPDVRLIDLRCCSVNLPKNARPGHPHTLRLNIQDAPSNASEAKIVMSVADKATIQRLFESAKDTAAVPGTTNKAESASVAVKEQQAHGLDDKELLAGTIILVDGIGACLYQGWKRSMKGPNLHRILTAGGKELQVKLREVGWSVANVPTEVGNWGVDAARLGYAHFPYFPLGKFDAQQPKGLPRGLLYYISTEGGTRKWSNPHVAGLVTAYWSSVEGGFGRSTVESFVSGPDRNDLDPPSASCTMDRGNDLHGSHHSGGKSFMAVDLGSRWLICTRYALRDGRFGQGALRRWQLEGAAQMRGPWTVLKVHGKRTPDKTLQPKGPRLVGSWPVAPSCAYRCFRIVQTGPNTCSNHRLSCGGLELFGFCSSSIPREGADIVRPHAMSGYWFRGDAVDVETEDGVESGAVIIGPSQCGDADHLRLRFADGVEDDWPIQDFRHAGNSLDDGSSSADSTSSSGDSDLSSSETSSSDSDSESDDDPIEPSTAWLDLQAPALASPLVSTGIVEQLVCSCSVSTTLKNDVLCRIEGADYQPEPLCDYCVIPMGGIVS